MRMQFMVSSCAARLFAADRTSRRPARIAVPASESVLPATYVGTRAIGDGNATLRLRTRRCQRRSEIFHFAKPPSPARIAPARSSKVVNFENRRVYDLSFTSQERALAMPSRADRPAGSLRRKPSSAAALRDRDREWRAHTVSFRDRGERST
jgi:hypothetical protein